MSYQEKRNIVAIISTVFIVTVYCLYMFAKHQGGSINLTDDLSFWGLAILIFIPLSIVVRIITEIIFNIINTIVTKEEEDPAVADERDKIIELKAMRISYGVVGVGFLLSLVSLVLKMPAPVMLNIVFFSFNIAEIIGCILQISYYRRGV